MRLPAAAFDFAFAPQKNNGMRAKTAPTFLAHAPISFIIHNSQKYCVIIVAPLTK